MKAKFKHGIRNLRGKNKSEELVYCHYNQGALCIARKYPSFEPEERHRIFSLINTNLKNFYSSVSDEYKQDLSVYSRLVTRYINLSEKLPSSKYAIFLKIMWTLKKHIPTVDLVTLTKEEVFQNEYPICTVAETMKSGILQLIPEAMMLERKM